MALRLVRHRSVPACPYVAVSQRILQSGVLPRRSYGSGFSELERAARQAKHAEIGRRFAELRKGKVAEPPRAHDSRALPPAWQSYRSDSSVDDRVSELYSLEEYPSRYLFGDEDSLFSPSRGFSQENSGPAGKSLDTSLSSEHSALSLDPLGSSGKNFMVGLFGGSAGNRQDGPRTGLAYDTGNDSTDIEFLRATAGINSPPPTLRSSQLREVRDVLSKWADRIWTTHSFALCGASRHFCAGEDWASVMRAVDDFEKQMRDRGLKGEEATLEFHLKTVRAEQERLDAMIASSLQQTGDSTSADPFASQLPSLRWMQHSGGEEELETIQQRWDGGYSEEELARGREDTQKFPEIIERLGGWRPLYETPEGSLRVNFPDGDPSEVVNLERELPDPLQQLALDKAYMSLGLSRLGKPFLPLAEGITAGVGASIWLHGNPRLVSPTARVSFPQTQLGGIPDSLAWLKLSEMSNPAFAKYLALTGQVLSAYDALHFGLAFAALDSAAMAQLARRLDEYALHPENRADVQHQILDAIAEAEIPIENLATTNSMLLHKEAIESCFSPKHSVSEVVSALESWRGFDAEWTKELARKMKNSCSPHALVATDALLKYAWSTRPGVVSAVRAECAMNRALAPSLLRGMRALIGAHEAPNWASTGTLEEAEDWLSQLTLATGAIEIPRRWLRFGQDSLWDTAVKEFQGVKTKVFVEGDEVMRDFATKFQKMSANPPTQQDILWEFYETLELTTEKKLKFFSLVRKDGTLDPWLLNAERQYRRMGLPRPLDQALPW